MVCQKACTLKTAGTYKMLYILERNPKIPQTCKGERIKEIGSYSILDTIPDSWV